MKKTQSYLVAFLACAAFLCTGCIDFTEEFFFNADGTGKMIVDIAVSTELMGMTGDSTKSDSSDAVKSMAHLVKQFSADPRVSAARLRDTAFGGMIHTVFEVDAKSFKDLASLHNTFFADTAMSESGTMKQGKPGIQMMTATGPSGNSTVKLDIILPRDSSAETSDSSNAIGESIANAMLGDSKFVFRVHGPQITSANGDIDSAAHMVEWKVPLMRIKQGKTLHTEIAIPGSMSVSMVMRYVLVLGVVTLLIFVVVMVVKRRAKKAA